MAQMVDGKFFVLIPIRVICKFWSLLIPLDSLFHRFLSHSMAKGIANEKIGKKF